MGGFRQRPGCQWIPVAGFLGVRRIRRFDHVLAGLPDASWNGRKVGRPDYFLGFSVTVMVIGRDGSVTRVLALGFIGSLVKGTWACPDAQIV